jgi:hypothetical protein
MLLLGVVTMPLLLLLLEGGRWAGLQAALVSGWIGRRWQGNRALARPLPATEFKSCSKSAQSTVLDGVYGHLLPPRLSACTP